MPGISAPYTVEAGLKKQYSGTRLGLGLGSGTGTGTVSYVSQVQEPVFTPSILGLLKPSSLKLVISMASRNSVCLHTFFFFFAYPNHLLLGSQR